MKFTFPHKTLKHIGRVLKWVWLIFGILVALSTFLAANAGSIPPEYTTIPALLAMAFPAVLALNVIVGLVTLFIDKRFAIIQWLALMLSIGAIGRFFPVDYFEPDIPDDATTIKLLTYNTFGFVDSEGVAPKWGNRTAWTILHSDADIVCLQEVGWIADAPARSVEQQIDSINVEYPYFASNEHKMVSILSRYPLREITLDQPESRYAGWQAAEVYVNGDTLLVVSLHLQSIGLNNEDKIIYHELTNGNSNLDWTAAGDMLAKKLSKAFISRADQARMLRHQLDSLNYRNVIIAGDFNDISGCYAEETIAQDEFKSVFQTIGSGPVITYHKNRFYFNIDHILYSDALEPLRYRRGSIKSSDHYPVYALFQFNGNSQNTDD